MAVRLRQSTLSELPAEIARPQYDRSALRGGILHIGVGNFHCAHQAVFLDRLFNRGLDHDWAVIGAGVRESDARMRSRLREQDWLSTVIELDPAGLTASVCGAMIDFVEVDAQALIERLADPALRIVSLTITEGGYFIDAEGGGFRADHPDILRDIEQPHRPQTVFGILAAGLSTRCRRNIPPFTVLSCDNLPGNGDIARQAVVGLTGTVAPDLSDWIESNVAFPNSMVDCITPATTDRERQLVAERFGIDDLSPVTCEPFRQWVLEDHFPAGRPALEEVGVEFVDDVSGHELLKLRVFNGGHAAIAYPAALLGLNFAHEAMSDSQIRNYLRRLQQTEIMPTVPRVPGVDIDAYFAQVEERFSNRRVADAIARLCLDGSNRQPKFILETLSDRLAARQPVDGLALEIALWCRYCVGIDEQGDEIPVEDEMAPRLEDHAERARSDPGVFLQMTDVFGSIGSSAEFGREFSRALRSLWKNGVRATLQAYAGS